MSKEFEACFDAYCEVEGEIIDCAAYDIFKAGWTAMKEFSRTAKAEILEVPSSEERKVEIFQRKLAELINGLSLENLCDTPDYILAEHLTDCLFQHARIINKRENWYGRPSK